MSTATFAPPNPVIAAQHPQLSPYGMFGNQQFGGILPPQYQQYQAALGQQQSPYGIFGDGQLGGFPQQPQIQQALVHQAIAQAQAQQQVQQLVAQAQLQQALVQQAIAQQAQFRQLQQNPYALGGVPGGWYQHQNTWN